MFRFMQFFTAAALTLFVSACDKQTTETTPDTAATEAEAYTELENQLYTLSNASINNSSDLDLISFSRANSLYKSVLNTSPSSPTANLGAALTEVFGAYSDTSINSVIKRWENYTGSAVQGTHLFRFRIPASIGDMKVPQKELATSLGTMLFKAMSDPPTVAEMQAVLRDHFVPRIDYALERLAVVETNTGFEFPISGKMQGDPGLSPVVLDLTEVYVMDAMLRSIKAGVDQFLVYQFNLPSYTTKAAVEALQPNNTTFFTLAPDGLTRAAGIHTNLLTLISRLRSGIAFLKAESDDQGDDIIKKGSSADMDTVDSYLARATTWLTSTQTVEVRDADTDGNNYTLQINLQSFFTNPPQNPKQQWLPAYTVDSSASGDIIWRWTDQTYDAFTFPDPTLSGIFPNMTNTTLKRLMHVDESFAWMLEVSLRDESYMLDASTTVTVTANGQLYEPKSRYTYGWQGYRYNRFLILNNDGMSAQINVTTGGVTVPIVLNNPVTVQLKSNSYGEIDITPAPQNITAYAYGPSPRYVQVYLNQFGSYIIERRTTGAFAVIDTVWWTSYYYDDQIPAADTYEYRAQRTWYPYSWGNFMGIRANNYTNTVSINVP